ncbi:BON domain-containing protein [Granulosicoccus antarcticus]|uniref:BON domain-containing protein n=1 Tax=Granulosicoccus antarcticus IMCC3135 TaxID=1192854 RepID=A0A2Z2NWE7_9GAMM|nr:BON domain-containing protein [Granulosicoccus antarcticus]ASJ75669.1 hypothetical protein IMCC3135_28085 [Granulosicoccus antarcticus IMCC3135]
MNKTIRNTLLVVSMVLAGSGVAMADQAQNEMLMKSFQAAGLDTGSMEVNVEDGVATLSGNVEDGAIREQIVQIVQKTDGITDVRDLITTE